MFMKMVLLLLIDSLIEARQKINEVISNDDFLYQYFHKDPLVWELKEFTPGYWTVSVKDEKILTKKDLLELGYTKEETAKIDSAFRVGIELTQAFIEQLPKQTQEKANQINRRTELRILSTDYIPKPEFFLRQKRKHQR